MKLAVRSLLRARRFTAFVVVVLALGIAANTSVFTIIYAVLLRDLPFREPDRLVWIWSTRTDRDKAFFSIPNFIDTQEAAKTLVDLSAFANWSVNLTGSGEAERLQGVRLSAQSFEMLGVRPVAGRLIASSDGQPGADRVVVLSHAIWQRRFGASPAAIGSKVFLNGEPFLIVGVLPSDFMLPNAEIDVASPLVFETDPRHTERGSNFLRVFGRLKKGSSLERTRLELAAITERLRKIYPDDNAKHTAPRILLLAEEVVGAYRSSLWTLFAAVSAVLAIACANLASLMVVRSAGRRVEIAICFALGANRARVARQFFSECIVLGVLGGTFGLIFAWWLLRSVDWIIPAGLPRVSEIAMDWHVLMFTAGLSILATSAFAVVPAFTARNGNIVETLKLAARSRTDSLHGNVRSGLVVVEVALSLMLMIVAGLLVKSFIRLQSVNTGVVAENVLVTRLALPPAKYSTALLVSRLVSTLLEKIDSPAAITSALPLSGVNSRTDFIVRGHAPAKVEDTPGAQNRWISDEYFKVMGIPLIEGRQFEPFDREGAELVTIVDKALKQRFMGDVDPVRQSLVIDFGDGGPSRDVKIVGVVGNVKHFGLDDTSSPTLYFPLAQAWPSALPAVNTGMTVVVKTATNSLAMADVLRRTISSLDADVATSVPTTMSQIVSARIAPRRFSTLLMEGFAGAGLLLAMIGLYAVLSYTVAQKRFEIGVRIALGARPQNVLRLVMLQGLKLAVIGCAIGLVTTFALSRAIAGMLYQTQTVNPAIYLLMCALLLVITAAASYLPAARAASTDPMKTLREIQN
jgi:predicted permease